MLKSLFVPAVVGLVVPGAFAADVENEGSKSQSIFIDEIVVSAQKRDQSLQEVSVAVSAFSGTAIEKMGFQEGLDIIHQVPNMSYFAIFGEASSPSVSLRGISLVNFSDSWESPVSMYVDDVYRGNPAGSAIQLFDLERIEVLRGPQGTLYGRNTTGGLVHYISRNPTEELEAHASVQVGSFSQIIGEGAISGPLTDHIRARVAFKYNNNKGWQTNAVDGKKLNNTNSFGYRAKVEMDLSEQGSLLLDVHGSRARQQTVGFAHLGYREPGNTSVVCSIAKINNGDCISAQLSAYGAGTGRQEAGGFWDPRHVASSASKGLTTNIDTFGASAKLLWSFDNVELTSISAYEKLTKFLQDDGDGTSVIWFDEQYHTNAKQLSQEIRLSGQTDSLNWVTGFYYYDDNRKLLTEAPTTADGLWHSEDVTLNTKSWAAFGQLEYGVTDQVKLIGGLRYTKEKRDFTQDSTVSFYSPIVTGVKRNLSSHAVTGRVGIDWTPQDGTLAYVSLSNGFKSGGFSGSYNASLAATKPVGSEKIYSAEIGLKHSFADGKGHINLAGFYYKLKDFQTQVFITVADGSRITNAGDVKGYGLEAELAYQVTDHFEITAGTGLLSTKFSSNKTFKVAGVQYSLDGNELPSAPSFTYNVVGRYYIDLGDSEITLQADYSWQASHYLQIENDPFSLHPSYGLANAKVSWSTSDGNHTIDVFVKNLTNKHYFTYQNTLGPDWGYAVWGKPRTFGARYTIKM